MKRAIYITGIIFLNVLLLGVIFKLLHLEGAGVLLTLGLGGAGLLFLPMAYINLLKSTDDKTLKLVYTMGFITFFIDLIGFLFKIQHWPGAGILLTLGIPGPFVLFLPAYIWYHNKRKLNADRNFFGILFFMMYVAVFSTFLAINASYGYLENQARMAEEINEVNEFLKSTNHVNTASETSVLLENSDKLIQSIEQIKKDLIIGLEGDDTKAIDNNGKINTIKIDRKFKNCNSYFSDDADTHNTWDDFQKLFKEYKTELQKNNYTKLPFISSRIKQIEACWNPEYRSKITIYTNISTQMNLLSDWQNKILLIKNEIARQSSSATTTKENLL